jgi:hypothetical protein
MRRFALTLTVVGLLIGAARISLAQPQGDEAGAIIDKAIKAHGIKTKDDKTFAYRGKNKGTLHVAGLDLEFNQDVAIQAPDKFKETLSLSVMDNMVNVITVFDGKNAWISANGMEIPITDEIRAEFKEAAHLMRLSQAMFLKDKALSFSLLGEIKVDDKPAVGIKVSKKGQKDIDFYFDKATGLLAKTERRALDSQSGQEVTEVRIIKEYKEHEGRKIAKRVHVLRDGSPFLEAEVLESLFLEKIDDSEFTKPG